MEDGGWCMLIPLVDIDIDIVSGRGLCFGRKGWLVNPKTPPNLLPCDGIVEDYGTVVAPAQADAWLHALLAGVPWQHDEVMMYGRRIVTARQMAWYGDAGLHYRYSGITRQPLPWSPLLVQIRTQVQARLAPAVPVSFNSCLLNRYEDGRQGMSWHADDEPELGAAPVIASLSLGASRKFVLRHRQGGQKISLMLAHGQLLVMRGSTQRHWQHALMKSSRVQAPRVNLTFRLIVPR